jgi:predicted DNA-binding transcriptional regulator YafY
MFSSEELAEIERLATAARTAGRAESARTLDELLAKLRALASTGTGAPGLTLFEEVLPVVETPVSPGTAGRVRRALERQEPLRIRYRANRSGEVTTRRIRPFNIHFYNGQEYVEAFCELRGSDRIFALGNIEEILDDEEGPPPPLDFPSAARES